MSRVWRNLCGALAIGALALAAVPALADNVVARWIQIGPGSSTTSPSLSTFGDAPASQTNTVLARAIITGGSCPTMTVGGTPVTMTKRFDGATLAGTLSLPATGAITSIPVAVPGTNPLPGTLGKTNGKNGYPQYFINAAATASTVLPGINGGAAATKDWTECEAIVPPTTATVAIIGGVNLKLPVAHPKRILVMADTGCRINGNLSATGGNQQNCQDAKKFPLQFLSTYEATFKPDLVVLVGDVFYRDTSCLTNGSETFTGCNTFSNANYETWGDTFDSWNGDFFFPARSLLATAPWVIVRGNHESCGRGARGWFALLDPHPYKFSNVGCAGISTSSTTPPVTNGDGSLSPVYYPDFTPTYVVPVGTGVNLLIHDSSFANDGFTSGTTLDSNTAKNFDVELTGVLKKLESDATSSGTTSTNIYVTHKPAFALVSGNVTGDNTAGFTDNAGDFTEQAMFDGGTFSGTVNYNGTVYSGGSAFTTGVPRSISLFLSGHVHQLEYITGMTHFPPTLIVGTGGDLLDGDMANGITPDGVSDPSAYIQTHGGFTLHTNVPDASSPPVKNGSKESFTKTYAHDEFGFAVLDAVNSPATGKTTGFIANAYKISSSRSGRCAITLDTGAGPTRNLVCNF